MPRRFFTPPPVVKEFDPARNQYRIFHEADWYNSSEIAKSYFSTGDAIYWIVRNGMFPMTPATWGYSTILERDYDKTALLPTVDLVDSVWKARDKGQKQWGEIFMAMGNGRYRGNWIPLEEARKKARGNFKHADPVRFEDVGGTPRYFFASRLLRYASLADFQKQIIAGVWAPGTVFVASGEAFTPGQGTVDSVAETANTATIKVSAASKSFLYMSVTPNKYWRIWIDGQETRSVVANVGFQGIVVPAGRHVITMRYRNTLVVAMATVSIAAVLFFAFLAILPRRRNSQEDFPVDELWPAAPIAAHGVELSGSERSVELDQSS
jgi:hypothetical protein